MQKASSSDFVPPRDCLVNVDLQPEHMQRFPSAHLFAKKASDIKDQMRRALFRQALYKIQNVEVTDSCQANRKLLSVEAQTHSDLTTWFLSRETILRQELWTIDRCGKPIEYQVTFRREGGDGFSTQVIPKAFSDKLRLLRFYYF